ncbi:MAG: peptidase and in kexin sedolisin [Bacteroidetes bacterium]|nr:peptidase and in kexin sedolisin [Bacteroidota bacterium]
MHKIYILLLVCLLAISSFGQSGKFYYSGRFVDNSTPSKLKSYKLSMLLRKKLQQPEYAHSNQLLNIMVQGNPAKIKSLVQQYGGVYKYAAGDISSVAIAYKNLLSFSTAEGIERIEAGDGMATGHSFMDTARIQNNIDSALLGVAPLTQAYKGTGVLVGIIDGGIYFRHKDFRQLNGNTRIRYIWDQADSSGTRPGSYNYGSEWDSASINAGTCGHKEPSGDQGHGTSVAGIAAGNGLSWNTGDAYLKGRYVGTAPEANIAVVRVDNNRPDYLATVADAVHYIFTKADELGMPCVINTSIGTYYGPHDGSEPSVGVMENLLDAHHGRVIVAAAGNGGNVKHHLSYQLTSPDSSWTWFTYNTTTHQVYFDLWADTAQFRNANFALGCDNSSTGAYRGRTRYFNAVTDFHPAANQTIEIDDTLFNNAHDTILGLYGIAVTAYQGLYHVEFFALPTITADLWRLETKGQGTFDLWASKSLIGTSNFAALGNPALWPNYRFPDTIKTIVSGWQCSDKVITVANYYNRAGYRDIDSNYVNLGVQPGALSVTSSIGPTRDGRTKPDIAATGDVVTTTGDSTYVSLLSGGGNRFKVSLGGKHVRDGGTSMASPIVAGIAALYLQEHPTASYSEVKSVIQNTAKKDTFTSTVNIPNTRFGWGKVNGYQALLYQTIYGCPDTGSINYVPNANVDTGGCIPKVYGCMDTGSVNYNPLANMSNGTCVAKRYGVMDTTCQNYDSLANVSGGQCIGVGIRETANNDIVLDVMPNPFSKTTTIYVYTTNPLPDAEIRFYDVLGKSVDAIKLPSGTKQITYNNSRLAAGVYDLAVVSNSSIITIKKVVVQ